GGDEDDERGAERQEQELLPVLAAEQQRRGEGERGEDGAEDDGAIVEERGEAGVGGERGGAEDGERPQASQLPATGGGVDSDPLGEEGGDGDERRGAVGEREVGAG